MFWVNKRLLQVRRPVDSGEREVGVAPGLKVALLLLVELLRRQHSAVERVAQLRQVDVAGKGLQLPLRAA